MKNKIILYSILNLLIIILIISFLVFFKNSQNNLQTCKTQITEVWVKWTSMTPLIENWDNITIEYGYYQCNNNLNRWDLVIYNSLLTDWSIVKRLTCLPWDSIVFYEWKIILNTEILKNSAWEEYVFNENEIDKMSTYIKDWKLQSWAYFIFWDNVTNSIDSRSYWAISFDNFIWKVVEY